MADSPQLLAKDLVKFIVKSNGTVLKDTVEVTLIKVVHGINRIPTATLTILDGDMAKGSFELSDKKDFNPGRKIDISAGYGSDAQPVFSGIVIKQGISIGAEQRSQLKVVCMDKCRSMAVSRHNANFVDQKDSDIITKLVGDHSGLKADVKATTTKHPEMVQYDSSDWDFMLSRAEANAMVVNVEAGKVSVAPPKAPKADLITTWGADLIEFEADMDASYQYKSVEAAGWDIKSQKALSESAKSASINKQGNIESAVLAKTLGAKPYTLQSATVLEKGELKDWAKGQQVKSALARIRGTMSFAGNAKAKPGTGITVKGVGKRFEGDVYVSRVEHLISDGFWRSNVEFGLSPKWSAEHQDLTAPPASGLLPPISGLQIGKVLKLDKDPQKQHRVQVDVPLMQTKTKGVWARLASGYATKKAGHFFIPEIGDEVVLGYFNNNPCDPVILGSLYSSANTPPYELEAKNETKAIVSKTELKVIFDDKDKIITLVTPGKNTVILDDKKKSITVKDCNSNTVTLSKNGIELDSSKNIKLTAKANIELNATSNIKLNAKGNVTLAGTNINAGAKANFEAKGNAGARMSSPAITTVKGSLVKIN